MGADAIIKVTSRDPKDTSAAVEEALGEPADITIECTGAPPSIRSAIYVSSCPLHSYLQACLSADVFIEYAVLYPTYEHCAKLSF